MKSKNNKFKKIILLISLIVALFVASFVGVFVYLNSKDAFKEQNNAVISVGIFDDGSYYISKAPDDIKFAVKGNDKNSYKLVDSNKKEVKSSIVNKNGKNYIVADKKYKEGETYYLELNNTEFSDTVLKDTKKIEFKIEEKEKAKYKLNKNVYEIKKDDLKIQKDNKIKINNNLKENDIILVNDDGNINNAYKVSKIDGDMGTITTPKVNEIYQDIDLYKEGKVNFDNIKINDKLEAEVEKVALNSKVFKFLTDVYAEEDIVKPKFNIKVSGDDITIEVEFKFKANGKSILGIEALKKHDLIVKISYKISAQYQAKIDLGNVINFDLALEESSKMDIKIVNGDEYLKGIEEISDDEYSKSIQDIVKKLQNEDSDVSSNSVDIGALELPTSIPGVNVYFDVYFQCQLSVLVNLEMGEEAKNVEHVGFVLDGSGLRGYKNLGKSNNSNELSITGKEEIKVGIGMDVGVSIVNKDIAHAEIGLEVGAYQEAFSTYKIKYESLNNKVNRDLVAKIELGIYLKCKVEASINILFVETKYEADLKEIKAPVFTYGTDEIIAGIKPKQGTVVIQNDNKIKMPVIEKTILNLDTESTRQENCDIDSIEFVDKDGNSLKKEGNYLNVLKNEDMMIYAVLNNGNNTYKAEIMLLKKGSTVNNNSNSTTNKEVVDKEIESLSIDTKSDVIEAYKKYILDKKYIDDYKEFFLKAGYQNNALYDVGYLVYDINKDGIPELIINAKEKNGDYASGWFYNSIYTYSNNSVLKINVIYNYGGIRYDANTKEIVYSVVKPTSVTGGYDFYKLQNNKLVFSKGVSHDRGAFIDGKYAYDKYYYVDEKGKIKEITKSQEDAYYKNVKNFSYYDINSVK